MAIETTEDAETNSVSSKRPSHQRDERTTGCVEEVGKGRLIIERKMVRKGTGIGLKTNLFSVFSVVRF